MARVWGKDRTDSIAGEVLRWRDNGTCAEPGDTEGAYQPPLLHTGLTRACLSITLSCVVQLLHRAAHAARIRRWFMANDKRTVLVHD
jgi:hypothetical protein